MKSLDEFNLGAPVLKTWTTNFQAVWEGVKFHEVRLNDRDYKAGQNWILGEWDPITEGFTGRYIKIHTRFVSYPPCFGLLKEGTCVFSFRIDWSGHIGRMTSSAPNLQEIPKP